MIQRWIVETVDGTTDVARAQLRVFALGLLQGPPNQPLQDEIDAVEAAIAELPDIYAPLVAPIVFRDTEGEPLLTLNDDGTWYIGSGEGLDFVDDGKMRPQGSIAGKPHTGAQNPARIDINGGARISVTGEIPELVFSRSSGLFATQERAFSPLGANIPDVTALDDDRIALATAPSAASVWGVPGSRTAVIQQGNSQQALVTYTDIDLDTNELTGVTYVAGSAVSSTAYTTGPNSTISLIVEGGGGLMYLFGQADMGKGGSSGKHAAITFETAELQYPDGFGGFHAGANINFDTSFVGPRSADIRRVVITASGQVLLVGSHNKVIGAAPLAGRRLLVAQTYSEIKGAQTIPAPASTPFWLRVEDPSGFATGGGRLTVQTSAGSAEITYTSWGVGDGVTLDATGAVSSKGRWYFKGCTATSPTFDGATIADGADAVRSKNALGVGIGALANIAAYDWPEQYRTEIGRIGPTTAEPEGGIQVGVTGVQPVGFYRVEGNVWAMYTGNRLRGVGNDGETPVFTSRVSTDTGNRWEHRANGKNAYGPGDGTFDINTKRISAGELAVRNGDDTADANIRAGLIRATNYLRLEELAADPGTASADGVRVFAVDDGFGGTVLKARFSSGVARTLARQNGAYPLTDAATIASDASRGDVFTVTLGGNRTMAVPSNPTHGQRIFYVLRQDGTGGRTIAWNATAFRFSADYPAPVLPTAPDTIGIVGFIYNSTDLKWDCILTVTPAGYQPLDADLTAIAALGTTPYGRAFLELANQAALLALIPSYQPLDSDLTALAALTTTPFGRALLETADAAALRAAAELSRVGNQGGVCRTMDPRGLVAVQAMTAINGGRYARFSGSKTGVTALRIFIGTSSGNISVSVYANNGQVGDLAAPSSTRKATTGAIACPASDYQTVTLTTFASGSSVDIVDGDWVLITADNITATFGTSGSLAAANAGNGIAYVELLSHPAPASVGSISANARVIYAATT